MELSSKSGRYDVVQNNIIYIPGFVKNGYIVPLDENLAKHADQFDKADFVPGYFNTNVVDGKVYGLAGLWREHLRHVPQGPVRTVRPERAEDL